MGVPLLWNGRWIALISRLILLLGMWEISFIITVALIIFLLPTVIGIIFILLRRIKMSHAEEVITFYLKRHGGSTLEEIVRGVELDKEEVSYCLEDMISRRIVKRRGKGEGSIYTLE